MMTNRQKSRALHTGSAAWRAIRVRVLAEQPLCVLCTNEGRVVAAVHVDHTDQDSHNNARENLRGLCVSHHSAVTKAHQNGKVYRQKGCDADGKPFGRDDW